MHANRTTSGQFQPPRLPGPPGMMSISLAKILFLSLKSSHVCSCGDENIALNIKMTMGKCKLKSGGLCSHFNGRRFEFISTQSFQYQTFWSVAHWSLFPFTNRKYFEWCRIAVDFLRLFWFNQEQQTTGIRDNASIVQGDEELRTQ